MADLSKGMCNSDLVPGNCCRLLLSFCTHIKATQTLHGQGQCQKLSPWLDHLLMVVISAPKILVSCPCNKLHMGQYSTCRSMENRTRFSRTVRLCVSRFCMFLADFTNRYVRSVDRGLHMRLGITSWVWMTL